MFARSAFVLLSFCTRKFPAKPKTLEPGKIIMDSTSYTIMNTYYPGEPVNIHIKSFIDIIEEKNWIVTTKKGKGKLLLFCGNLEQVITLYDVDWMLR